MSPGAPRRAAARDDRRVPADPGNRSVVTALTVLEHLGSHDGLGVSELARQLDLPKSTVQRTLGTLRAAGWVRQDDGARWSLTLRCAVLGQRALNRTTLNEVARPVVTALRDRTGETARCWLVQGTDVVLLDLAESAHAVRAVADDLPGATPLHATAIGKATLAARPEAVAALLEQPLARATSRTLTDPAALRRELDGVRRRGWAESREETHPGVGGVAAVSELSTRILVGVGVTYPMHRVSPEAVEEYGELVRAEAAHAAAAVGPRVLPHAR